MDRDWHTDRMMCSVCDRRLEPASQEEPERESVTSHGSSDDDNSDDDHIAPACPALQCEEDWGDWEDVVEEFRQSLPKSIAAMAASTLDRGQADVIEKHMVKDIAPAMPSIAQDRRQNR